MEPRSHDRVVVEASAVEKSESASLEPVTVGPEKRLPSQKPDSTNDPKPEASRGDIHVAAAESNAGAESSPGPGVGSDAKKQLVSPTANRSQSALSERPTRPNLGGLGQGEEEDRPSENQSASFVVRSGTRSTEKKKLLSLETFDETSEEGPILNSPRSLLACAKLGLEPIDLVKRPISFFAQEDIFAAREILEMRERHHETRRKGLLSEARGLREGISEGEGAAFMAMIRGTKLTEEEAMFELEGQLASEKHAIRVMRDRQKLEIEQMLSYEIKYQILTEENDAKMAEQARRAAELARIRAQKRFEYEQGVVRATQQRLQDESERLKAARVQANVEFAREAELRREAEMKEREARRVAQRRELERMERDEARERKNQEYLASERQKIEDMKTQMRERDEYRMGVMKAQRQALTTAMNEKRKKLEDKVMAYLKNSKEADDKAFRLFEEKKTKSVERHAAFLEFRKENLKRGGEQAKKKAEFIKELLAEQERTIEERRQTLVDRADKAAKRLEKMKTEKRMQEALKIAELEARHDKIEISRQNVKRREIEKRDSLLDRQRRQDAHLKAMKAERERQNRLAREEEHLRKKDKLDTVLRQKRRNDFYRKITAAKIDTQTEKYKMGIELRNGLIKKKKDTRIALERERGELMATLSNWKRTKHWLPPQSLSTSIDISEIISRAKSSTYSASLRRSAKLSPTDSPREESRSWDRRNVPRTAPARLPSRRAPLSPPSRPLLFSFPPSSPSSIPLSPQPPPPSSTPRQGAGPRGEFITEKSSPRIPAESRRRIRKMIEIEKQKESERGAILAMTTDTAEVRRLEDKFARERATATEQILSEAISLKITIN